MHLFTVIGSKTEENTSNARSYFGIVKIDIGIIQEIAAGDKDAEMLMPKRLPSD